MVKLLPPSTLGKEIKVISKRLSREIETFKKIKGLAKFSGATGNYHTFNMVDSSINWQKQAKGSLIHLVFNKTRLQLKLNHMIGLLK